MGTWSTGGFSKKRWQICKEVDALELMKIFDVVWFRYKVETAIHDSIRELVTWECKELKVKSW